MAAAVAGARAPPPPAPSQRWGDVDDDDAGDTAILPPPTTSGPDSRGIKTTVEYKRNDKGEIVRVTSRVRVVKVEKKLYKVVEERRHWPRFGAALDESSTDSITVRANEEIPFERARAARQTTEERKASDMKSVLQGTDKSAIVGSLKDLLYKRRMERQLAAARGLISGPEMPPMEDGEGGGAGGAGGSLLPAAGAKGGYVPPSVRNRGAGGAGMSMGESMHRRGGGDDNSVRVTNLSEDTREDDLRDLFSPFGQVSRVYIAADRETGESRGFGFVNFVYRADGQRAIDKLDGYGYDSLILRVEWAAPRGERP